MLVRCSTQFLASLSLALPVLAQLGPPPVPAGNPITTSKALLGKALFFEEQLSSTRTVACGTCHDPLAGGADSRFLASSPPMHPGADGVFGTADDAIGSSSLPRTLPNRRYRFHQSFGMSPQVTSRQTNAAFSAAYAPSLFWDGRAGDQLVDPLSGQVVLASGAALEVQALEPILSETEMGHQGRDWSDVVGGLQAAQPLALATDLGTLGTWINGRDYPALFMEAFGTAEITPVRIAMALATYQRTLVPDQTPVEPLLAGQPHSLNLQELQGGTIFRSMARGKCVACHSLPLYGDDGFHYTGVRPAEEDPGLFAVTGNPADMGKMRTPSLRNVEFSAPYFKDGRFATLEEVVEFYDRGGDFDAPNKDPLIQPLNLTPAEKAALVVYLKRPLTDERVAAGLPPFDRPTLYGGSARVPQLYGTGSDGTGAIVPRMIALEPALVGGGQLTLGIEGALGGAGALLLTGPAADLAGTPFQGATLHLAIGPGLTRTNASLIGQGAGEGWASLRIDPPQGVGASLYAQWLVFDQNGSDRFAATEAVELVGF